MHELMIGIAKLLGRAFDKRYLLDLSNDSTGILAAGIIEALVTLFSTPTTQKRAKNENWDTAAEVAVDLISGILTELDRRSHSPNGFFGTISELFLALVLYVKERFDMDHSNVVLRKPLKCLLVLVYQYRDRLDNENPAELKAAITQLPECVLNLHYRLKGWAEGA